MTCSTEGHDASLATALRRIVGSAHVLEDASVVTRFEQDWTGRFRGRACVVVRPADTDEVARVLQACHAARVAVVPQGGNTGLVGGGVPRDGEVVLSLTRLSDLRPIDPATRHVEVGAGVTLRALQEHAREAGLDAGVDFAARDSATVGGLVACDAGGLRALRYGTARARVAGLEVALADGSVIELRPSVLKDNAGYALPALMIGSEGTLGVITRVRWQLVPLMGARVTALLPLVSMETAVRLLATLRPLLPSLEAAEFTVDAAMRCVLRYLDVPAPFPEPAPVYLLLECAAKQDPTDEFLDALQEAGVEDALIATDTADRLRLWRLRESQSDAVSSLGTPKKFDVGVPLERLAEFIDRLPAAVRRVDPGATTVLFGHLGDGNVHVNVVAGGADYEELGAVIFGLTAACGGTISAEHGIGVEKAPWLHLLCSSAELDAMIRLKQALDPDGVLNPGVAIPDVAAVEAGRGGTR